MASAVGQPLDVDRATYDKTRPSTARDDEENVKDLDVGAEKSGVQDQNLVRQNSGQCQGKAMLDDYSSGNQVLSLIPQTGESSRQSCNSVDRVGVEEQLVMHSNQQNNKSKDAQFAQKTNEVKDNEIAAENSSMRHSDKHTPGELHEAIM
ncbi:hypothetical protein KY285_008549 [Solanum tuberosum]|nr:hypothetical protein KY285_008549 [Solanum tuberosum]